MPRNRTKKIVGNAVQRRKTKVEQTNEPITVTVMNMLKESERLVRYGEQQAKSAGIKPTSANRIIHDRRKINARIAEPENEFKEGRTSSPFDTAAEVIAHMKAELQKKPVRPKSKRKR